MARNPPAPAPAPGNHNHPQDREIEVIYLSSDIGVGFSSPLVARGGGGGGGRSPTPRASRARARSRRARSRTYTPNGKGVGKKKEEAVREISSSSDFGGQSGGGGGGGGGLRSDDFDYDFLGDGYEVGGLPSGKLDFGVDVDVEMGGVCGGGGEGGKAVEEEVEVEEKRDSNRGKGKSRTKKHRFEDPISSWDIGFGFNGEEEGEGEGEGAEDDTIQGAGGSSTKPISSTTTKTTATTTTTTAKSIATTTTTTTTARITRRGSSASRVVRKAVEEKKDNVIVIEDTPVKSAVAAGRKDGTKAGGRGGVGSMKGMEMDLEVEFSPGTSSLLKGIFGRGGRRGGGGDEDEVLEKGVKGGGKKLKVPKAMTRKRTSGGGGGGEEQEAEKRIEDVLADYSELPAAKGGDLDGGRRLSAPKAAVRKRTSGGGGSAVVGDGAGAAEKVGRAHVEGGEEEASKEVEEEEVDMEFEDIDEIVSPEPTKRRRISKETGAMPAARIPEVRRNKTTVDGKEERARKAAEKAAEREAAKETKRIEREAKLLEKQREAELATVNKLKTSKKESVKEMIVDISSPFSESPAGLQLVRFLETQECQSTKDWVSPVPNVVKWRRKVTAELDEELGHYVPVRLKMKDEKHILVVLKGEEFVDMGEELDNHVRKIKTILGDSHVKPIYLIEGLNALLRKSKNAKNRNFQGAVRQAIGSGEAGSAPKRAARRKSGTRDYTAIDEDVVEDALLNLQITHGCLIHHTATMQETSEWISVFTRDISYIPYKERMDFGLSFCTDVGQVKTGVDSEDTFFRMLQEINRVTAGVANGIMHEHKTVGELVAALKIGGEEALADLPMMANKMGVSTGRAIGSATSKRIYRIFMGQDPFSADV